MSSSWQPTGPMERVRFQASLLEAIGQAVIATDVDGTIVYMNRSAEQLYGWPSVEALGKPVVDLIPADETREDAQRLLSKIREGDVYSGEFLVRNRNGRSFPALVTTTQIRDGENGEIVGLVGVSVDLTAYWNTEKMRRRSELDLHSVVEAIPDAVFVTADLDGRLLFVNPAAVPLAGAARADEMLGRRLSHFIGDAARLPSAGEAREVVFRHRDGGSAVVETTALSLLWGGASAKLLIARNVTESRQLEARLRVADRMASVGTLASGVAHEINNPLAFVIANLEWLRRESSKWTNVDDRAELDGAIRDALEGSERVRVIVQQLRTFSRPEETTLRSVDVRSVLDSVLALANNEIRHRARLLREFEAVPRVFASESQLAQVFLNILVNAAQAIPEGAAERNTIRVSTGTSSNGEARIEISDTGSGMSSETLARIFDPFFTTKRVGVGTGLGLSICHNTVSAMGGTIDVDSTIGAGTTFRIVLPAATTVAAAAAVAANARARSEAARGDPAQAAGGAAGDAAADAPARLRILVVDDEPQIGSAIARSLATHADFEVHTSGRAALDDAATGDFDAILCDVMMPEMSGPEFFSELRARNAAAAERIVFMTGGAFTERARTFLDLTRNPTLEKPIRIEDLQRAIASLPPRASGRASGG